MATRDKAAIRRATVAAHKAVEALDADSLKALKRIYDAAASDIATLIRQYAGPDNTLTLAELRSVLAQVDIRLQQLSSERNTLINVYLDRSAALGTTPFFEEQTGEALARSTDALRYVRNFVAEDGLQLSDRIWRIDRSARDVLTNSIEQAVIQGQSAVQTARELLSRGEPVPADVQNKLDSANAPRLAQDAVDQLTTGRGNPLDNAVRLMRTELNRAHGEAYMMAGADQPDFAGWRFLLSPAHPKPDVCLRAGSLISTQKGEVPIEDVRIGDLVLTHQGRYRAVTQLYRSSSGQSGLVRLCFREGSSRNLEVVMTPNHPVLTPQGWIPAGDLRTGHRVVCLSEGSQLSHLPFVADEGRKALSGSGGIEPATVARRAWMGLCDALALPALDTVRNGNLGSLMPSHSPMSDVAKRLSSCCRLSIADCRLSVAHWKATSETRRIARTSLDDVSRSSDCSPQGEGRMPLSSIFVQCYSSLGQTIFRKSNTALAGVNDLSDSIPLSRTLACPLGADGVAPRIAPRNRDMSSQLASPSPAILQSTSDRRSACLMYEALVSIGSALATEVSRRIRMFFDRSFGRYLLFSTNHIIVDLLESTGENVFNLEVADDHSYVANGLVVHNCDLLSRQNLYGLGPGVYPSREKCPWPAHPNTLSFLEIVFKDEITDSDREGKQTPMQALGTLTDEQRAGVLGKGKDEVYKDGKMRQGMIRAPWMDVKRRVSTRQ